MSAPSDDAIIGVVGLGYVGLPLAVAFGRSRPVIGFDLDHQRIQSLAHGIDKTLEVGEDDIKGAKRLSFTSNENDLAQAGIFIVTVPTPIDAHKRPDLRPLKSASETVARSLKPGDVVIYESTVYPGCTEEECVPLLEKVSGLRFNTDFFVAYSPERVNPGDKAHRLEDIVKITSGSTPDVASFVDALYRTIIRAGTHLAPSIRVAEAAKVIENTQRDLNIALVNELAKIFSLLDIDTGEVLKAAQTKWNFLPFKPGLVGGHCIGVDPYYLTHKAQAIGYHPEIILAGRRINDGMGRYVAGKLVKGILQRGMPVKGAHVLIMGLTFKENCPDLRNTRVIDVISELASYGVSLDVYDPWANSQEAYRQHGIELIDRPRKGHYHAILVAVAHREFIELGVPSIRGFGRHDHLLYDLKHCFDAAQSDMRL